MNLDLQSVLIGVINSKLDYLIVLGKQHLWYCRRNLCSNSKLLLKWLRLRKCKTENLIAVKCNGLIGY